MNDAFWKQFPGPIPGFDCVEMKRVAQRRIYAATKGMTTQQVVAYFARRGAEIHAVQSPAVAEPQAPYGDEKKA